MKRRYAALATLLGSTLVAAAPSVHADELASGAPSDLFDIEDEFISGLEVPTALDFLPDGRMVVAERNGTMHLYNADGSEVGTSIGAIPVEIPQSYSERGLLNVMVHPQFATNRLLIIYYSKPAGTTGPQNVATVALGEDDQLDLATLTPLVEGLAGNSNHIGGGLAVSNDGNYLYVGVGDTGCNSNAPPGTVGNYFATCLTNPQGKVLRVNLDGSIPSDNPLSSVAMVTACGSGCMSEPDGTSAEKREDIFAWGFRNPWRLTVDPETGNLWVGDVGEITYEEVNVVPPAGGKHYGFPWREGRAGQPTTQCSEITPDVGECVEPVYYCRHPGTGDDTVDPDCESITGGIIVSDCRWPEEFRDRYVFGDYKTGGVWTLKMHAARDGIEGGRENFIDSVIDAGPLKFVMGPDGALYYTVAAGNVVKVSPKAPEECPGSGGAGGSGGTATGGASASGGSAGSSTGGTGATTGGTASTTGGTASTTGGTASTTGGTSAAGGAGGSGGSGGDGDDGCGCKVAGGTSSSALAYSALGLLALSWLRRRRR